MKNLLTLESYGREEYTLTLKRNPSQGITFRLEHGIIKDLENSTQVPFPYRDGQTISQNFYTWACNRGFLINGDDPCPEKKVFGIKTSQIPQGHELRRMYPNKFR